MKKIYYTLTDESPALASVSLLPILQKFLSKFDIDLVPVDISLASRILAAFGKAPDTLKTLSSLVLTPDANLVKLPNISATQTQLNAALGELAAFDLPPFESAKERYKAVLGSAVNPVIREGNSLRRCPKSVKNEAALSPSANLEFDKNSKTAVFSMSSGDFYENEKSFVAVSDSEVEICFNGERLKTFAVKKGDIVSATFMSLNALDDFVKQSLKKAKNENLLFGVHLKSTMMKNSDPLIFGRFVRGYCEDAGVPSEQIKGESGGLDEVRKNAELKFENAFENAVKLCMVKDGVSCLDAPNHFIIDASVPLVLKNGGKAWGEVGWQDTLVVIPDRSYARVYASALADIKHFGALKSDCGSVENVGLMAQQAEEYGSHDKSFVASEDGEFVVRFVSDVSQELRFAVKKGDIFRGFVATKEAVSNWIHLAQKRANESGKRAIFWLDQTRAHDLNLANAVREVLPNAEILDYESAVKESMATIRRGEDVVSVTGNILRDYLTDLFPILEVGTSSKMLSIVPLLRGGGLFETGAGGTAPLLLDMLLRKNHFAWDSLGEFMALTASVEAAGERGLALALDAAVERYLKGGHSPKMEVGEFDTRVSHFFFAKFVAEALSVSDERFVALAGELRENERTILDEFAAFKASGSCVLDGYYRFSMASAEAVMRPSKRFNEILERFV